MRHPYGPASVALPAWQAGAQGHTALAGLFKLGFVPSSAPELELFLSQGAWFSHEPDTAQMVTTSSGEQISKSTCLPSPTESLLSGETLNGAVLTTGLEVAIILAADSCEPGQTASDTSQKPVSEELSSALLTQPFHQMCLDVSTSPAAHHGQ